MASNIARNTIFDPAQLRERITILKATSDANAPWKGTNGWQTLATIWAGIHHRKQSESLEAEQRTAKARTHFVIRYRGDIKGRLRITHAGQLFDVRTVSDPDMRKNWLLLEAVEAPGQDHALHQAGH